MAALLTVADTGIRAVPVPVGPNRFALRRTSGGDAFDVLLDGALAARLLPPIAGIAGWTICPDLDRYATHDDLPVPFRRFYEEFDAFHEACSFLAIADAPLPPVSAVLNLSEAA